MTQRSILAGTTTTVIIKAGSSVTVRGCEGGTVTAITTDSWGLQIGKKSDAEIGRARAAIGDFVLFDVHIKTPLRSEKEAQEVIEVQMGGSGQVLVPFGLNLKIYAGMDIDVQGVNGQVDAYSGRDMSLLKIGRVGHASAGRKMDLDGQTLLGDDLELTAGSDLRFHIRELTSARIRIKDLGGFWEVRLGDGASSVYLKSGGDVTLVTDQVVEPLPPNYILGKIEKPTA